MDQAQEVKAKTDIVKIIGEQVTLKKAGRNYKGLCPFHSEKTPSFMVSPDLQIYKCFGCGESGDVFSFLQKQNGMDFYEALKLLADQAGITLKVIDSQRRGESAEIYDINELSAKLYHYLLLKHKYGKEGLEYLRSSRGLEEKTIKTFKLGIAPDKPKILFNYLHGKKGISTEKLIEAGVIIKTERGFMDRFRGRVIFPIFDPQGRVVALAGRVLPKYDRGFAKYINSPETPIYHKSRSLYGLSITKNQIRKQDFAIVVEGELDLLMPWQNGFGNIVAAKGTALTAEQMSLLSRYTKSVVLALDSDFAGDNAAVRAVSFAQEAGLEVRIAQMGDYKDPDEFVRADKRGFEKAIKNAVDVWEFIINFIFSKFDADRAGDKAKISSEVVPILASINDNIIQAHYAKIVAQRLNVPVESVAKEIEKVAQKQAVHSPQKALAEIKPKQEKSRREILEERVIGLGLLISPEKLIKPVNSELISSPYMQKLIEQLTNYLSRNKRKFKISEFISFLPVELRERASGIFMSQGEQDENELEREFVESLIELKRLYLREQIASQSALISKYARQKDSPKMNQAQQRLNKLSMTLKQLV